MAQAIAVTFGRFSPNGYIPTRRSPDAAGYDLRSAYNLTIPPSQWRRVETDVWVILPQGHIGIVSPCSDWTPQCALTVEYSFIDDAAPTNIAVNILNSRGGTLNLYKGVRIAQLTFVRL